MLEQEILDVIHKNLPSQVGEALKQRLDYSDELEERLDNLSKKLQDAENLLKIKKQEEDRYNHWLNLKNAYEKILKEVEAKQQAIDKRNNFFELELTKVLLSESIKRENQAIDLVRIIFRNPVCRTAVNKQGTIPIVHKSDSYGTEEWTEISNVNITETTEKEIV